MYDRLGFFVMQKRGFVTEGRSREADVFSMDKLMSIQCGGNNSVPTNCIRDCTKLSLSRWCHLLSSTGTRSHGSTLGFAEIKMTNFHQSID